MILKKFKCGVSGQYGLTCTPIQYVIVDEKIRDCRLRNYWFWSNVTGYIHCPKTNLNFHIETRLEKIQRCSVLYVLFLCPTTAPSASGLVSIWKCEIIFWDSVGIFWTVYLRISRNCFRKKSCPSSRLSGNPENRFNVSFLGYPPLPEILQSTHSEIEQNSNPRPVPRQSVALPTSHQKSLSLLPLHHTVLWK